MCAKMQRCFHHISQVMIRKEAHVTQARGSRIPGESGESGESDESGDVVLCYVHFQKCVAFCAKAVMKELRKMIEVSALGPGVDTWIMQC